MVTSGGHAAPPLLRTLRLAATLAVGASSATPALAGGLAAPAHAATVAGPNGIPSDFNGDGYSDLAIGVPGETYSGYREYGEGRVVILYGSSTGLTAGGRQSWSQQTNGIAYTEWGEFNEDESGDDFGEVLATGDFDGDGFADLAIGAPGEHPIDDAGPHGTGAVHILSGSPKGLKAVNEIRWADSSGVDDFPIQFGSALAGGDFDGDGVDDLAILGAWSTDWYSTDDAIAVAILPGSPDGLSDTASTIWREPTDSPYHNRLASGDVDGDGIDDLAVGSPWGDVSGVESAGLVRVLFGDAVAIGTRNQRLTQDTVGLAHLPGDSDRAGEWEEFGWALEIGDFDADGRGDLAVGAPREGVPDSACSYLRCEGAVTIVPGAPDGLDLGSSVVLAQGFDGMKGSSEKGDAFGSALASGDVNRDGWVDLAIGAPGESIEAKCPKEYDGYATHGICGHGAVTVVYGSAKGLRPSMSNRWTLETPGVPGRLGQFGYDRFGTSLVIARFGRSRAADLAIGTPAAGARYSGIVHVLYGRTGGLSAERAQLWSQETRGIPGTSDKLDYFGFALGD